MVSPAPPVPLISGLVSSVTPLSLATLPLIAPWSSITLMIEGAAGAPAETSVKLRAGVSALALPTGSTSLKVMACSPLVRGVAGVKLQLPWLSTSALPSSTPLSNTWMVLPATPVPLKVGKLSSVAALLATSPLTAPTSSTTLLSAGAAGGVTSTVKLKGALGAEVLPAASVLVAVKLCVPSVSGLAGVIAQLPLASTTAVPKSTVPSKTLMVLPTSPVPVKVGVVSSLLLPLTKAPCTVPTSSAAALITGAAGAAVSTVKLYAGVAALSTPAALVAVAVRLCTPGLSAVVGLKLQAPLVSAVVLPSKVLPSYTFTVLPAGAVPLSTGMVSLVLAPWLTAPVTGAWLSVTLVIVGTLTALVSTVKPIGLLKGPTLPAGSTWPAVRLWGPFESGVVGVKLQLPLGSTTAVPMGVLPPLSKMLMVAPGSPLPLKVGVVSSVVAPGVMGPVCGATSSLSVSALGAAGKAASTLKP